ncbi:hypothetical protein DSM112329_00710 [Paraconexibacter sp. AEG42_29]|uniref:Tat pathway signal sequence domain protein n=1 Tax=Paraconexibacter sp. AEG42_29 TaxID=2997339 RepID=A0AAU7AQK5_9ACTN
MCNPDRTGAVYLRVTFPIITPSKENFLMHSRRRPRARTLVTLACLAGVVPVAGVTSTTATAATYTASKAATCSLSTKDGTKKGGYFTSLKATGLSCSSAKSVMKAHDKCRLKKGRKATCTRVSGYKCTEKRGASIPTEYSSTVTCKKGSKKVVYSYSQDTA